MKQRRFGMCLVTGLLLSIGLAGCSGSGDPPPRDEAEKHIFCAAMLHQRFPLKNQGRGAKNDADLKKFMKSLTKEELENMGIQDAETALISPRDNQPYVINWKAPTMADLRSMKGSSGFPYWIMHEQTGVGGKRWVALSMGQVRLLDDEGFKQFVK